MSDQLTPEECARIRAYCEVATPRPWQEGIAGAANIVYFDGDDIHGVAHVWDDQVRTFIIEARTDLPRLLDAYEQAVRERDALKAAAREVYAERFEGDWSPRWERLRKLIEDV